MANIAVLHARDLTPMFVSLVGELPNTASRKLNNKRYRTLLLEISPNYQHKSGNLQKSNDMFYNWIQLNTPNDANELMMKYPDEISGVAPSVVAKLMVERQGNFEFGLGDIEKGAPFLFFTTKAKEITTAMIKWMRANFEGNALIIRHDHCLRVSFSNENDFVLTRLKFS